MSDKIYESLALALAGAKSPASSTSDKVVALNGGQSGSGASRRGDGSGMRQDWSSTVDLVHEAHEAMRISEERVEDLEARLNEVISEAQDEIFHLTRRAEAAEAMVAALELDVRAADTRAQEAETWLVRLNEVVVSSFGPILRERENATPPAHAPLASSPYAKASTRESGSGSHSSGASIAASLRDAARPLR